VANFIREWLRLGGLLQTFALYVVEPSVKGATDAAVLNAAVGQ
jgi:hypothetical protein